MIFSMFLLFVEVLREKYILGLMDNIGKNAFMISWLYMPILAVLILVIILNKSRKEKDGLVLMTSIMLWSILQVIYYAFM